MRCKRGWNVISRRNVNACVLFSDFGGIGSILTAVVVACSDVDTSATWHGTEASGSLLTKSVELALGLTPSPFIETVNSWLFHDDTTGNVLLHPASECTSFVLPETREPSNFQQILKYKLDCWYDNFDRSRCKHLLIGWLVFFFETNHCLFYKCKAAGVYFPI